MKRPMLFLLGLMVMSGAMRICFASFTTSSPQEVQALIGQTQGNWTFKRLDAVNQLAEIYYSEGQKALMQGDLVTAESYFYCANTDTADNRAAFCCLRQAERLRSEDPDGGLLWIDTLQSRYEMTPYLDTALLLGANVCLKQALALKGATYLDELAQRNPGMLSSTEASEIRRGVAELCLAEIESKIASQDYGTAKVIVTESKTWIPVEFKINLAELERTIENNENRDRLLAEASIAFSQDQWGVAISIYRNVLNKLDPDCEEANEKIAMMVSVPREYGYGWSQETIDRVIQGIIKGTPEIGMDNQMVWVILGEADYSSWESEISQEPTYSIYGQQTGTRQVERSYLVNSYSDRGIQVRYEKTGSAPNDLKVVAIEPFNR